MVLDDSLRAILRQPLIARVTTIGTDGYPHTVPIWYILDGDDLVIATGPQSRKVRNVRANPKGAVAVGGDPVNAHDSYTAGYLFQGEWALEGDPDFEWIRKIAYRYRDDHTRAEREFTAWGPHQALRFTIHRAIKVM
ncbi:MAG: pyridoxamine 5'-phosphate oxidase family protein [Anaerolineae bacterium]|nr:pyridoxamine 5'-phosphate oxidase family protein [Anaerolineae bacterium]